MFGNTAVAHHHGADVSVTDGNDGAWFLRKNGRERECQGQ